MYERTEARKHKGTGIALWRARPNDSNSLSRKENSVHQSRASNGLVRPSEGNGRAAAFRSEACQLRKTQKPRQLCEHKTRFKGKLRMENTATKSRVNKSSVVSDLVIWRTPSVAALRAPFPTRPFPGRTGTQTKANQIGGET
jgi:hypothetical protein